jgi:hypothetical protein
MQTSRLLDSFFRTIGPRDEDGAIGWLALGILIGAVLIIVLLVKLLIPGD